ncbi:hypothetical protein DY000_02007163 [Brassica cretica]|nr:hypothetical protein DY000_02007163 [Brassica cretica]
MVNLPICCSEHEASMCFSEHGGTLLMSLRSWSEPRRRGAGLLQIGELLSWMSSTLDGRVASLSLGIRNHSAWKPEVRTRRRDPDLGTGPWKPKAGTRSRGRDPEAGAGNNMVFFIGLRELHRSIKFLVEFGVGRRLVAWAIKLPCR